MLQSKPTGKLVMFRVCMEPFRMLVDKHLELSGEAWETRQRTTDLVAMENALGSDPRRYRACEAASGALEENFFDMVRTRLFDKAFWALLPAMERSIAMQNLTFKILSRMGYAV